MIASMRGPMPVWVAPVSSAVSQNLRDPTLRDDSYMRAQCFIDDGHLRAVSRRLGNAPVNPRQLASNIAYSEVFQSISFASRLRDMRSRLQDFIREFMNLTERNFT